jgi:hypothetical protein
VTDDDDDDDDDDDNDDSLLRAGQCSVEKESVLYSSTQSAWPLLLPSLLGLPADC